MDRLDRIEVALQVGEFKTKISRVLARQYGEEAVAIIRDGGYTSRHGIQVSIAESVHRAVEGTVSYPPDKEVNGEPVGHLDTAITVENTTTLAPVTRLLSDGYNPVILNFASATSPGGGFLNGARAQEEYLCRSSALYACLRDNPIYAFHHAQNDALYSDYVIYSPHVPVFRDDGGELVDEPYTVSVITSPAVNAKRVPSGHNAEIYPAMRTRIHKVLATGVKHGHDAIVLGAWGCGAFGCDSGRIAGLFKEALGGPFHGAYARVVFAIVDWSEERRFIGPFEVIM